MKKQEATIKDLQALFKKYQARGLKPYFKGKGNKFIKIQFEGYERRVK